MAERVKPLGAITPSNPATYTNDPSAIGARLSAQLDDVNRTESQYLVDRGEYSRPPIGPTNYQEANIMPSQEQTGVAGYNQQGEIKFPERAADLNKAQYLVDTANSMDSQLREQMQILTSLPQQNFVNTQDPSHYFGTSYRMPNSLPLQPLPPKK